MGGGACFFGPAESAPPALPALGCQASCAELLSALLSGLGPSAGLLALASFSSSSEHSFSR